MLTVRKMRHSELDRTQEFVRSLFPRSAVRIGGSDTVLLAEKRGRPVGFVHIVNGRDRLLFQGIGVVKAMRGKGVGTLLMEKALAMPGTSYKPVYLKVKAMNRVLNLYSSHGFFLKRFGRAHVLVKKPNS